MVRSTIDLAHALGLTVVAEGVEDWDTAKLLSDLGCDYAQGFVIGRAVDIDQFRAMSSSAVRKAA
jgi:EAL domain-containing protein (putative c-di-GMP-specific phosphodiesterase class I)